MCRQWRIQKVLKGGVVKQKGEAVTIKIQYFGEKSLESSMKSVSNGGAAALTSSAIDPPLKAATTTLLIKDIAFFFLWIPLCIFSVKVVRDAIADLFVKCCIRK